MNHIEETKIWLAKIELEKCKLYIEKVRVQLSSTALSNNAEHLWNAFYSLYKDTNRRL